MIGYQRNRKLESGRECSKCKDKVGYEPSGRQDQRYVVQPMEDRHSQYSPTSASEKKMNVEPEGVVNATCCPKMSELYS